jgi:hypothetical protein
MAYLFITSFSKTISALVEPDKVSIDNWVFKLFYRITPMLVGVCTVLVCTREYIAQGKIRNFRKLGIEDY